MQPDVTIDEEKLGSEYLTTVQALSEELACATAAIAQNDIETLEKHIESQQRLCAQLLSLDQFRPHLQAYPATWTSVCRALRTLNRNKQTFSTLLATSGRSHQVLLALCKAYKESAGHVADEHQGTRTLSCEV